MAFSHLEISDSNYKHCLSKDEWDRIEKLSKFLGVFYEITCMFSGTKYPTTNLYFPAIFKARLTLEEQKNGDDLGMRNMAIQMFAKFEKYWSAFSLILAVAVILDPRYKINFVDWSYKQLYGHDSMEFKKVKESLFSLYNEYANKISPRHASSNYMNLSNDSVGTGNNEDDFEEFDNYECTKFGSSKNKSELEIYLDEQRIDRKVDLNILHFLKGNQFRYPQLAAMARDILSIPVSTVASESTFSVGGRILDQ
ncbi:PREDICTED: zinc finger BED domain-containing protein RICESLEEPER 1-like [Ipomoea nil]|uniref:zinc finger BED domain-containing protein RICESLEEPER 1-like n=1 Tax=Ipomoea nil TaxID=35883 RepID=UPI000901BAED|nr:PREDICTED: zinc finger BED domain-containing protein RICESLEEPER 1-like [Ipomoea nil]